MTMLKDFSNLFVLIIIIALVRPRHVTAAPLSISCVFAYGERVLGLGYRHDFRYAYEKTT